MNLRTATRGASTLTIVLVTLALLSGTALAYWTTIGAGSGQASAGTLLAPTGVTASPISGSSTSLRAAWSHPSGLQPTSYAVTAGSQSCSATYPAATCDVTGLTASTAYSVVVTSRYNNAWTAPAAAVSGTTNPAAPNLTVTTPANGATGVATNTAISGGTNATGSVAVQIYLGTNTSVAPVGTLTGAVTGATWTTPPATLLNSTQYTAVATQSTAGGSTSVSTTFTTAAPPVTASINASAAQVSTSTNGQTGNSYRWGGVLRVTVTHSVNGPVQGAVVTGTWSYPGRSANEQQNAISATPPLTCTTDATGTCDLTYAVAMGAQVPTARFTIDTITGTVPAYVAPDPKTFGDLTKP